MDGDEIAARARACVGVRFRPQGRTAETGLDCVGLAAFALGVERVPGDYALRGGSAEALERGLRAAGLMPVEHAQPGDVLAMQAGFAQPHLGIATGSGFVHAHAGLRRVVETPGPPDWPVLGIWRMERG